jgi:ketosteroid isomerase-like protein
MQSGGSSLPRDTAREMSQENTETIRRLLGAFKRRDKADLLALCDPEIENVPPENWPQTDPILGAEAVVEFFAETQEPWGSSSSYEYGEVIDAGIDEIVAHVRGDVQGKTSGASVVFSYWVLATFRDGKVLRLEWFSDRGEALKAARLSE